MDIVPVSQVDVFQQRRRMPEGSCPPQSGIVPADSLQLLVGSPVDRATTARLPSTPLICV